MTVEGGSPVQQTGASRGPNPVTKAVPAGAQIGEAVEKAVQSAFDTVDLGVQSLKQVLKVGEQLEGEKLVDANMKKIKEANQPFGYSVGMGATIAAAARFVLARVAFHKEVLDATTEKLRAARDYGISAMAKPNDRETEQALKFIVDAIHHELDRRKERVVPVPVPCIPFQFDVPPGFWGE